MIITLFLIIANILIFILTLLNPDLISQYGMSNSNMNNPVIWITSMFIHSGYIHIIFNMIALLDFGIIIEEKYGKLKFFTIYFFSGIIASLFSYIFLLNHNFIVIGASGAIFGLWAYISFVEKKYSQFLIFAVITNIAMIYAGLPIAWFAHLGGAIAGIIFAMLKRG